MRHAHELVHSIMTDHDAYGFLTEPYVFRRREMYLAFDQLRIDGVVDHMLVVAPLTMIHHEWVPPEQLVKSHIHGSKHDKLVALRNPSPVIFINPYQLKWLNEHKELMPRNTMLMIDSPAMFRNDRTRAHEHLMSLMDCFVKRFFFTSTFINSYLDLFGQIKTLDSGNALGTDFWKFRNKYFHQRGGNGKWSPWIPNEGTPDILLDNIDHLVGTINYNPSEQSWHEGYINE